MLTLLLLTFVQGITFLGGQRGRRESRWEPDDHAEKQQRLLPWCIIPSLPCGGLDALAIRLQKTKKQNVTSIKHSGFLLARCCHARDRNILLCHALSFSPSASASLILSYWKRRLLCHSPSTPPPPPPAPSTHSFPHPLPLLPLLLLLLLHTGEITCSSVPAGAAWRLGTAVCVSLSSRVAQLHSLREKNNAAVL